MASAKASLLVVIALVAASCGTSGAVATSVAATDAVVIANQGGDLEGHTPIGFAGSGTGLFAGDNLNSVFPEGDGVQTFLTFSLPDGLAADSAVLTSDALHIQGAPFDDLGPLLAEPVEYKSFGPDLFDLPAADDPIPCRVTDAGAVECNVTAAVQSAIAKGQDTAQFRLRFERVADNDGQPDLALFYRADSNTNEPGLFGLLVNIDR
jgi:hypothetical protein